MWVTYYGKHLNVMMYNKSLACGLLQKIYQIQKVKLTMYMHYNITTLFPFHVTFM